MIEPTTTDASHRLEVSGELVAKARPRASTRNGKVRMHMPDRYTSCVSSVAQQLRSQWRRDPFGAHRPLSVEVQVRLKRPQDRPSWCPPDVWAEGRAIPAPTAVGDVDNLAGTILDAGNGVVWRDDAQVVRLWVCKVYAADDDDDAPVTVVWVMEVGW